jgi:hypothetical protein
LSCSTKERLISKVKEIVSKFPSNIIDNQEYSFHDDYYLYNYQFKTTFDLGDEKKIVKIQQVQIPPKSD